MAGGAAGARRRLVLNQLTAEVRAPPAPTPARSCSDPADADLEYYHELELFRQLLALSPPPVPTSAPKPGPRPTLRPRSASGERACPSTLRAAAPPRSRTFAPASAPRTHTPPPSVRPAKYLGSFPIPGGEPAARVDAVSDQLQHMKESGRAVPVLVAVALSGVRVCDPDDQSVRMSHALRRISYATCDAPRALFAFVARAPHRDHPAPAPTAAPSPAPAPTSAPSAAPTPTSATSPAHAPAPVPADDCSQPSQHYCHAFHTDTPQQAEELNALVGDAFRMAFASQLQPSAPLWSKELSGSECGGGGMGLRAPDSLPGLTHHYPLCADRSPGACDIMGVSRLINETSPSSSDSSPSPVEVTSCYRRLGAERERPERGERPPLMKRLALGLSGALLQPSDDDSTPLVTDTPTTPTNVPLCMNGYINEASEAEARTRASNREPASRGHQAHGDWGSRGDDTRGDWGARGDDFRHCGAAHGGSPLGAASESSGASSCETSAASGNNNPRAEPELTHAPWFQAGIPREIALEVLSLQPVGAFLVRASTTQAGCLALSVRVPAAFAPRGLAHYLILRTPKGYKIKGFTKEFGSLSALVTHHSVMPELLPCPLRLPRPAPAAPPAPRAHPRTAAPPAPRRLADIDALCPATATPAHKHNLFAPLDV